MINRKGFTLFELLIVISILSLLAVLSISALTSVRRSGRDARRKSDLEEVRTAIEQWRSDKGSYPLQGNGTNLLDITCSSATGLVDNATPQNVYLQKAPKDPGCSNRSYHYTVNGQDYTLAAALETGPAGACQGLTDDCGGSTVACNYCLGPYGQKP